ncbi:DUF1801 domain-containing protein (plasmid) [Phyllobacterium sp. 628]|uniref:DUF1801 domain-containing protein n=1 Tax=Phyllobacterium sp. 628 TaxID=2718938 RepID=UPI0016625D3D|nr:DUF1801 domain-containing protein [Phyllobacterium sp. 628]QND54512.1 DUF1801 domain-containing protein [Phyllobacterium sp. 628]QND54540.1 DUF1801 domain-containing protein [Phyllobacterium sp. 628]
MFKVIASNVEQYFGFDPRRENDLRSVDTLIVGAAPNWKRWFVAGTPQGEPGMRMSMIGYGHFHYSVKSSRTPVNWPVLGMALQKNNISLYLSARDDAGPVAEQYAEKLGRVSVSKTGAIRFRCVADLDVREFTNMLHRVERDMENGILELRYGRVAGN